MKEDFVRTGELFPYGFRLEIRETAGSTNDEVRLLAEEGEQGGLVLLALEQTAGRGRKGASWFCGKGESLAFSILVRPEEGRAFWPRLALAAGVAVAEAAEEFGVKAGIKWPNDVWVRRLKLAGILVEAGKDFVVVGIGINVNTKAFPVEVAEIATSLEIECGKELSRSEVLAVIVRKFSKRSQQIGNEGFEELLECVQQRCVLTGHQVSLKTAGGPKKGIVEGIGQGGELLLRSEEGLERLIQADEVRIVDL